MPRYFFHRINGSIEQDQDGLEFTDLDQARREAVVFAGETLKEQPRSVDGDREFRVEMTNVQGDILYVVRVFAASPQ